MNPNGNIKHGGHGTLTYARWKSMMQRCNNPKASNFKHYGGKGISVCDRWRDFSAFLQDMGECPDQSMTLDRIENHIGYTAGNCRWATKKTQNRNRSSCVQLTHNGETKLIAEWAAQIGISPNVLAMRIRLGWTVDRALTQPLKNRSIKSDLTKIYRKAAA